MAKSSICCAVLLLLLLVEMDISAVAEKEINCTVKCSHRCSKASRHKMCKRACIICCHKCHCVPPGTYGHREKCPVMLT